MASLLWGGLFAFLSLYTLICAWIWLKPLGRSVRHKLRFTLTPVFPESGLPAEMAFPDLQPPPLPPGFRATLRLTAEHSPHRKLSLQWRLSQTGGPARFLFQGLRGAYQMNFALEIQDVLGFCRIRRGFPGPETLTVIPHWAEAEQPRLPQRGQGDKPDRTRKVRTQELLETRKYHPGDDVRRIHWGLYAHLGEPFLRIGEENPPPAGKLFFIIDPSVPHRMPKEAVLDDRLARCRQFLSGLNQPWVCLFPQGGLVPHDSQEKSLDHWAQSAAGLKAQEPELAQAEHWCRTSVYAGELKSSVVQIVSSPGCPGLAALAQELSRLGIASRPFLFPLPEQPNRPPLPWWKKRTPEAVV